MQTAIYLGYLAVLIFVVLLVIWRLISWPKSAQKKNLANQLMTSLTSILENGTISRAQYETGLHGIFQGRQSGAITSHRSFGANLGVFMECKYPPKFIIVKSSSSKLISSLNKFESLKKIEHGGHSFYTNEPAIAEALFSKSFELVDHLFMLNCSAIAQRDERKLAARNFSETKSANYPPGLWATVDLSTNEEPNGQLILERLYELASAIESLNKTNNST